MTPVTDDKCDKRSSRLWRALQVSGGLSVVIASVFGWVLSYAIGKADHAVEKAHTIDSTFKAHEEGQKEAIKHINTSLDDIKGEQGKQRSMIEDLWKSNSNGGA